MEYNRPGIEKFISKLVGMKAEDLDWASSLGKKYGEKEELDGRGDAARHLALGWLAANAESPGTAKRAIQTREYLDLDYIRELIDGKFAGKEMDLRNNELGMKINAQTKEEAEKIIYKMIGSGEATYMSPEQSYEMRGYATGGKVEQEPAFLEALERQRLREQAFDNEFAIEVAAQSNYAADIDPSIARYYGMSRAAPGYDGLRGFEVTPSEEYPEGALLYEHPRYVLYDREDQPFSVLGLPQGTNIRTIFPESGTVAAIDKHATPVTYAHEYRHKFFPELSERENRIADLLTALDEKQLLEMLDANYGKGRTPTEALDYFRYDLRFERDNPGYGIGAKIFGSEWDRGARATKEGRQDSKDKYIRARIKESSAIKLLNEYEELEKYNEELREQNKERKEEAAVKGYAMGGGVGSLAPVARNMYKIPSVKRGVGAYIPYTRR